MQPPTETPVSSTSASQFNSRVIRDVELVITRGRARHRVRSVTAPVFMIGTAPDCDLVLGDDRFPEVHAYLLVGQGPVLLRWLGLDPEITVNGAKVDHVSLRDMDRIRTGPYEFLVRIGEKRRKRPAPNSTIPAPHYDRSWADSLESTPDVFDPTAEAAAVLGQQLEQIEAAMLTAARPIDSQEDPQPVLRVYRGPTPEAEGLATEGEQRTAIGNIPPWPQWPMNHHVFVS